MTPPKKRGRPPLPNPRSESVHAAVTRDTSEALDRAAEAAGVTRSTWAADAIAMRLLRSEDGGEG